MGEFPESKTLGGGYGTYSTSSTGTGSGGVGARAPNVGRTTLVSHP